MFRLFGNKCQLFSNSLTQTKITSLIYYYQVGRKTNVFLLEWFIWQVSAVSARFSREIEQFENEMP